ncbi:Tyrosine kinase receptor Cad96Ca, partial [Orchesella cincta]
MEDLAHKQMFFCTCKIATMPKTLQALLRLSRRLYNYSVYVRRKNTPLPWRWLSVEALVDMKFSTMSDVWSYGICCWEIFELGKRPWCNYPQLTLDFISDIKNGVRLEKPNNCRQNYFDDILFPCWKHERSERPKFAEIVDAWRTKTKTSDA